VQADLLRVASRGLVDGGGRQMGDAARLREETFLLGPSCRYVARPLTPV